MMRKGIGFMALTAAAVAGWLAFSASDALSATVGEKAPAFTATTADGKTVSLSDFAGKVVTFCGHARHNTIEPLVSNSVQKVEFRIYWLGVPGTPFITSSDSYNLLPADLKDVYKPVFISGLAPTNATGVRAQVIFRSGTTTNPSITNGAAIVDDVRLSIFDPVFPEGTLIRMW